MFASFCLPNFLSSHIFPVFPLTAHSFKGIAVSYIRHNQSICHDLLHRLSGVLRCYSKNLDTLVWAEKLMSNDH